jgi:hypothetical protein
VRAKYCYEVTMLSLVRASRSRLLHPRFRRAASKSATNSGTVARRAALLL